jgi:glycosyltransferase involved in cell wall biosynthesis
MRIGIDAFGSDQGRSGLGSYLRGLAANIPVDSNTQVELFGPEIDRYTFNRTRREVTYRGVTVPGGQGTELFWHKFLAAQTIRAARYDAVLYAAGGRLLPPVQKVPAVAMVEDLLSVDCRKNGHYQRICRRLTTIARIIVPSTFIKKDLMSLGIDEGKIVVIHQGLERSLFFPRPRTDGDFLEIKPFAIQRPYLIYPSRVQGTGKRHVELVQAFNRFKEKTHAPHRLVLAGTFAGGLDALTKEVAASPFASDIVMTGYFPYQNMPLLYASADACVFPGQEEGVGLPVIEAMASGIPVTCAKSGALPEIAGSHALFFDSANIEDMANALEKIVFDKDLREKFLATGVSWAQRYSWKTNAELTLAELRKVAG